TRRFTCRPMRHNFVHRAARTFSRDSNAFYLFLKEKREMRKRIKSNRPVHEIWLERMREHPMKEAAIEVETERRINYGDLNRLMNKYANYFAAQGYKYDDVVALFMENNIDFIAAWFGLSKIGVISAFINTNIKLEPLGHSIDVSKCTSVITTMTLLPTLANAKAGGFIAKNLKVFVIGGDSETAENLENSMITTSDEEPPICPELDFHSVFCYIYTSGTTGFPKPSVIKHCRYYFAASSASVAFGIKRKDRMYITLPFYHSSGSMLGIGSLVAKGTTIVIRKKFSASNFWTDAIAHECTMSQYIGEICRYLLAQKPTPEEKQHKIRTMFGNGLRLEIWEEFISRFGIKRVREMYGATEGNSNFVNLDNHVGACGFLPIYPFTSLFYPVRIVKINEETGELLRDKRGLAISCRPGESGEMVGIINNKDVFRRFDGYVDKGETEKKIYRDVFSKGDMVRTRENLGRSGGGHNDQKR
ncbi:hypothetical protein PMAYCL1PPCAC_16863, partial [Pristionchus mayeri]